MAKVVQQKMMSLNGDEAVAWAAKQSNVDVVAAFPITPQTIIMERIAEFIHDGEMDAEIIRVESEHSALSASWGAAVAGARAFTATAANGLALMWEILYIVSSTRTPVVMAIVNRALSGPINIHCDHGDSMGARDSGWIQIYSEDAQEAYDNVIQAFRISEHEDVLLPVMVMLDGFLISHTMQNVQILPDEVVSDFVGVRKVAKIKLPEFYGEKEIPFMLNPKYPISIGPLDLYDYYFEHKMQQIEAMRRAPDVIRQVHKEYAEISGRSYGDGMLDPYKVDDADALIVGIGSTMGTLKAVVDEFREEGKKLGSVRIRIFRPFPADEIRKLASGVSSVGVLDRSASFGAEGGPLFLEVRSALYSLRDRPPVLGYVYGLGGRDMPPKLLKKIAEEVLSAKEEPEKPKIAFPGVRE